MWSFRALLLLALCSCGPAAPSFPDRAPGERKPLASDCDETDPQRCGLPFPSNVFTTVDSSTATGLRVSLQPRAVPLRESPSVLNHADGFSRISPIATAFSGTVDAPSAADSMVLLVAQPDAPDDGARVPLRVEVVASDSKAFGVESMLIAYPLRPMSANSDHVVVVLDSLRFTDGSSASADHLTRVALKLDEPANDAERARAAYHAPTRAALEKAGIEPQHVARVWDFTTRSGDDARRRVEAMREKTIAAVTSGSVKVELDKVTLAPSANVAAVVIGRLTNMPSFPLVNGALSLEPVGVHDAPFRVMIPNGTGDYRICLYGHGTGGTLDDDLFDDELASRSLGKANGLFYGWNDAVVLDTFLSLTKMVSGVADSSAGLMQAMADYAAIERGLNGVLGDALSGPMLGTVANPANGRRPNADAPIWTGGSLGGTLGMVYSGLSSNVHYAVLNVPGTGWTHFIPESDLYEVIRPGLQGGYPSPVDFRHALIVSQLLWDDVDGANYSDDVTADGSVYLVQMSMGDPVLPNVGSALVASTVHAVHLGKVLEPVTDVLPAVTAENRSALTQFKVSATSALERHGFASRNTPAGAAARDQISSFIQSVLDGQPRITVPAGCLNGSCDFSGP